MNSNMSIRNMTLSGINIIYNNFKEQNWNKPKNNLKLTTKTKNQGK